LTSVPAISCHPRRWSSPSGYLDGTLPGLVGRDFRRSPVTRITQAAPSPVGPHMGSVFGQAITSAFMISSRLNAFRYCE